MVPPQDIPRVWFSLRIGRECGSPSVGHTWPSAPDIRGNVTNIQYEWKKGIELRFKHSVWASGVCAAGVVGEATLD